MAINEARTAFSAPGAVEEVGLDVGGDDRTVILTVRLKDRSLADMLMSDLVTSFQSSSGFPFGPLNLSGEIIPEEAADVEVSHVGS